MRIEVPISSGELLDKLTILEIKSERISDPAQLKNVGRELDQLECVWRKLKAESDEIAALRGDLRAINQRLWDIEDEIRALDARADFGPDFVELARSVYRTNDQRAWVKRRVSELLGSDIIEEKSYVAYPDESAGE